MHARPSQPVDASRPGTSPTLVSPGGYHGLMTQAGRARQDMGVALLPARPRRVLLLTDSYRPTVNGVVASIDELRQGLLEAGHEVRVLTVGPTRRTTFDGEVYRLPSLDASHIYPHARLGRPVDRDLFADLVAWRPEVLHSHTEFVAFWWARRLAHRLGAPHVHTYHTLYADYTHYFFPHERTGRALCARFARGTLNRTDLVLAPTAKIEDLLRGYGVHAPVRVVPTGVDLARFAPGETSTDLRASLGLTPGVPVVLSLGRLAAEKNLTEVVDLLATVTEPWQLVVAGDGPLAGPLRRQVDRLGLTARVRFVGAVEPARAPEFYRLADVFVSGSRSETQGLTYLEALACGVPVLCRDDSSVDGVVLDDVNGHRYRSAEEFTRTMDALLRDGQLRRRWSQGAVRTATGFGRATFAAAVGDAYDEALRRTSTTGRAA